MKIIVLSLAALSFPFLLQGMEENQPRKKRSTRLERLRRMRMVIPRPEPTVSYDIEKYKHSLFGDCKQIIIENNIDSYDITFQHSSCLEINAHIRAQATALHKNKKIITFKYINGQCTINPQRAAEWTKNVHKNALIITFHDQKYVRLDGYCFQEECVVEEKNRAYLHMIARHIKPHFKYRHMQEQFVIKPTEGLQEDTIKGAICRFFSPWQQCNRRESILLLGKLFTELTDKEKSSHVDQEQADVFTCQNVPILDTFNLFELARTLNLQKQNST